MTKKSAKRSESSLGLESVRSSKNGYWIVLGVFATLVVIASVLIVRYRQMPKPTEILDRQKRAMAKHVSYAVIFNNVRPELREKIINDITSDVGADTSNTDFVVGSTVADPWCASITEYRQLLRKAMTQSKTLPIGKQTLILSMVAGLLAKTDLPARVYLIGSLNNENLTPRSTAAIVTRTQQTVTTIEWRNGARAPVEVISYLDTNESDLNRKYLALFKGKTYTFEGR